MSRDQLKLDILNGYSHTTIFRNMNKASPTECEASKTAKVPRAIPKRDCTSSKVTDLTNTSTADLVNQCSDVLGDGTDSESVIAKLSCLDPNLTQLR